MVHNCGVSHLQIQFECMFFVDFYGVFRFTDLHMEKKQLHFLKEQRNIFIDME
ncbi:hypothetical protein HanRHA438_Chr07g0306881 [Helianthus annuus]|nr:hypothetical protein HanIR_Chr07g0320181 [Helianthus annuus]KAJ0908121.1 hypothetical protein HanRHA438_Chr07g0306881 [Helianthus annuus]